MTDQQQQLAPISFWQSRTIWSIAVAAICQVADASGHHIDPSFQNSITDFLVMGASLVASGAAIYFRWKARPIIKSTTS